MQTNTLEQQLFEQIREGKKIGKEISLERALLIANGVDEEGRLLRYLNDINSIYFDFITDEDFESDPNKTIDEQALRFASDMYNSLAGLRVMGTGAGEFLLTKAIDMVINNDKLEPLDCFGMTQIYTILSKQLGLNISVVEENEHVFNRMKVNGKTYDIDHRLLDRIELQRFPEGIEHDTSSLVAFTYIKRADRENAKGNYGDAIELYTKAILVDPEFSDRAYINRAGIRIDQEKYEDAREDFEKAISIDAEDFTGHIGLAFVEYYLKNYDEAMRHVNNAGEIYALNSDLYYTRALVQYDQDKKVDALRNCSIALGLENDHEGALDLKNIITRENKDAHRRRLNRFKVLH